MTDYKQYDPSKVMLILGTFPIRGFADGDMIVAEYTEDKRTMHVGTDGEGRHVKQLNRSGTITIRLADYTPSNAVIAGLDLLDEPFPITVVDKASNGDLFFAASCTLRKEPPFAKGKEAKENEYVFQFVNGALTHMGAIEL